MAAPTDTAVTELANELRFVVAKLHRQLRQQDQSGLSPSLATALATIAREDEITLGRLAAHEQVTPPTVTRIVESLIDLGLVTRRVDEGDKRVSLVRISPAGRRRLDAIRTRRTAWLASRLSELDPQQVESIHSTLAVLESLLLPPTPPPGTAP